MFTWIVILLVAIRVFLFVLHITDNKDNTREKIIENNNINNDAEWPYYAKKPLTDQEQILYFRLLKAFPEHVILSQVGLSRILGIEKRKDFIKWFNSISQMTVDFIVCTKDMSIVTVIELDDSSHDSKARRTADSKKDRALSSAGIKIVRFADRLLPNEMMIRNMIMPHVERSARVEIKETCLYIQKEQSRPIYADRP